jgi:uncharacterized membrane protein HdeD (DUF308 family)
MKIAATVLMAIPAVMAILSGVFKISNAKQVTEKLGKINMAQYAKLMGAAEIIFALIFLYPPTSILGFALLVCYFSGALAVDLSYKQDVKAPIFLLVLIFSAMLVHNPSLFFSM